MCMIMLDLETMGNNSNSAIVSIGAVAFDENGLTGDEFYVNVNLQSCLDAGLKVDGSTVMWWMQQSEKARASLKDKPPVPLDKALDNFARYCGNLQVSEVWGNGCMFDNTILGNAYRAAGREIPWKFWNDRCYRTIKNMYPQIELKRVGELHNAVDDAKTQALHLIEILKLIKGEK